VGSGIRPAGRLLLLAQVAQPGETTQLLALMAQLAALTDAVTRLSEAQDRAGQACAVGETAKGVRTATARYARPDLPLGGTAANPPASGVGDRTSTSARRVQRRPEGALHPLASPAGHEVNLPLRGDLQPNPL